MKQIKDEGVGLLDHVYRHLEEGHVFPGLEMLLFGLWRLRSNHPKETWAAFAKDICPKHPLCELAHQSALTRRAFYKPRGYPGDAETIDYIYGNAAPQDSSDPRISEINRWGLQTSSCQSVRERRDILAGYIDRVAQRVPGARMLSLACGHLREAQQSRAVQNGELDTFFALDHDPRSLQILEQEHPRNIIKPIQATLNSLLRGKLKFEDMDFVYGAGIFDYLGDAFATALTALMFAMLRPQGVLLIANFAPNLTDTGYMEAFMAWNLIYRDELNMEKLVGQIPRADLASLRTFRDSNKNLVFLEIQRAGA